MDVSQLCVTLTALESLAEYFIAASSHERKTVAAERSLLEST